LKAKRTYYTIAIIAEAANRTAFTVRKHSQMNRFDRDSLRSVALYIAAAVLADRADPAEVEFD